MSVASAASMGVAHPQASARPATLALIVAAIAIACSPIFVRLSELGPTATAVYRTGLGLPLLGVWWLFELRSGKSGLPSSRAVRQLVLAGFCFAGDLVAWHWSIKLTAVANAALLANLAPIIITLGAWYLFGERVSAAFAVSIAGALCGSIILASATIDVAGSLAGDFLACLTALFYAGYFLAMRDIRRGLSTASAMSMSGLFCTAFLLPIAVQSGEQMLPATAHGWTILAALALVSQLLGQCLLGWALAHLPVAFAAVSLLMQPIVSSALGWVVLGEPLRWQQYLGGTVILASVICAQRASFRQRPAVTP